MVCGAGMNLNIFGRHVYCRGYIIVRESELVEVSYLSFTREKDRRVAQKQSVYSRVQGTGGCLISTCGTAAVVRWEIGGGIFEDLGQVIPNTTKSRLTITRP